jgi:hypothetical protein
VESGAGVCFVSLDFELIQNYTRYIGVLITAGIFGQ